MATEIFTALQSKAEIRQHVVDFTNDLPAGITVTSATATHTPPLGGTATTPTVTTATPLVRVTFGPVDAEGQHVIKILATYSDAEKSEIRLSIPVNF